MKLIFTIFLSFLIANASQFTEQKTIMSDVTKETATIPIGSLSIGQSGVVVHDFKENKLSILTNAIVTASSSDSSTITFEQSKILEQDAIPTTNLEPKDGDIFILNHLYNTSLLIVPNHESMVEIKTKYNENNFIDSDIFAAYLKINDTPVPEKEDIVNFAKHNNIGTIYIEANSKLNILDTLSFKIIKSENLSLESNATESPFFTNVEDIKTPFFSWFAKEKVDNYHEHYSNLIGANNDRK